jgi:hypothetical protein
MIPFCTPLEALLIARNVSAKKNPRHSYRGFS